MREFLHCSPAFFKAHANTHWLASSANDKITIYTSITLYPLK